jgi:HK97 family phage major capsid protein
MDTAIIESKQAELAEVLGQIEVLAQREDFEPADADELKTRATHLRGRIDALMYAAQEASAMVTMGDVIRRAENKAAEKQAAYSAAGQSMGEVFTRSKMFTSYTGHGHSGRVETGILTRALPSMTSDFGALLKAGARKQAEPAFRTPLLDLVPTVQTSLASFPIWGLTVADIASSTHPPAAKKGNPAAVVAEGDAKPPVQFTPTEINVAIETIAVYTQLTRQALEDIPFIRSMVDTELQRLVLAKVEERIATALTGASLATADGEGDLLRGIRIGYATVQAEGFQPTAVLLNPQDWATLDMRVMGATLNGPQIRPDFFGLTPVASNAVTAGTAIVGDFATGVQRFERAGGVALYITDSHADTFVKNVFTILAEIRDKPVVTQANALVKVSEGTAP